MVEDYIPYRVYTNATRAMKYRGGVADEEPVSIEVVTDQINNRGYVTFAGQRPSSHVLGEATIIYVIIAPNSRYASKSQDFKKLLKLVAPRRTTTGRRFDIIFIHENSSEKLFKDTDAIDDVKALFELNINIYAYSYNLFLIELPKHKLIPQCRILYPDEVKKIEETFHMDMTQIPVIVPTDAICAWYGIRPGHHVGVIMSIDTAGEAEVYRYCTSKTIERVEKPAEEN